MEIELNWRVRPGRECRYCGEMRIGAMAVARPGQLRRVCKRCMGARGKAWRVSNPEKTAAWRASNRDKVNGYRRNSAAHKAAKKRYREKYPDKVRAWKQRRRATEKGARTESFSDTTIFERDAYTCYLCGRQTKRDLPVGTPLRTVLEHRTPLSRGGSHSLDNCATACWECNARKGAKTEEEYKEAVRWATNQSAA